MSERVYVRGLSKQFLSMCLPPAGAAGTVHVRFVLSVFAEGVVVLVGKGALHSSYKLRAVTRVCVALDRRTSYYTYAVHSSPPLPLHLCLGGMGQGGSGRD